MFADRLNGPTRSDFPPIELIPDELIAVLKAHDWPGNIRELQDFIERPVLFSPGDEHYPQDQSGSILYDRSVTMVETWGRWRASWIVELLA